MSRLRKRKLVSVERKTGGCSQQKAKAERMERKHNRPLLLQGCRHKMTEEDFRQEVHQEAVVFKEGKIKGRADTTSNEIVRIRHVIIGILPFVKITILKRDANSAESAYSGTLRLTVSPTKAEEKVVEKDLLPDW